MGQDFILFNLDKKQSYSLDGKFGESWGTSTMAELVPMLAPATVQLPEDPLAHLRADKTTLSESPFEKTGIHSLATEIHGMIFEQLNKYHDAYALCLTNTYFWIVGIPRLRVLFVQEALKKQNLWVGGRLVCLGRYTESLPQGLITEDEEEELLAIPVPNESWEVIEELRRWTRPIRNESWYCSRHYAEMERFWGEANYDPESRHRYPAVGDWEAPFKTKLQWEIKADTPYILRNLSKQVYMRADEFALNSEDVDGIDIKKMSFGYLIFSKIAWSDDDSMCMSYADTEKLHRGSWVGDRFDVMRMDKCELEGWTDITKEAKKDLTEIWETEHGVGWHEDKDLTWIY